MSHEPFLLCRLLMHFGTASEDMHGELSSVTFTPDGSMWTGSDEMLTVERLSPLGPHGYGKHHSFHVGNFVSLFNHEDEIDIEGMDYADGYLWFTGSHSTKRKKAKGKKLEKDLKRLATVRPERNRYTLARIPVHEGELLPSYTSTVHANMTLTAGRLQATEDWNILMEALEDDEHLGGFLTFPLPNKENGFDIEGIAVRGDRVFLGLRGPVLGRWAVLLEIEVFEQEPGTLGLREIGSGGRRYKKHFVDLNGMGVRELCLQNDDLIILAGPTMDLEGAMEVFRLHNALDIEDDSLTEQEEGKLDMLFDLPFTIGSDHAEGLALYSYFNGVDGLLVVYDSPDPARVFTPESVFADVFLLR